MVAVRTALAGALVVLTGVLAALSALVGLSGPSWAVGALCGVVLSGAVARAGGPAGGHELGPADLVTLARATITCAVAALVAESWLRQPLAVPVAALAAVAHGAGRRGRPRGAGDHRRPLSAAGSTVRPTRSSCSC